MEVYAQILQRLPRQVLVVVIPEPLDLIEHYAFIGEAVRHDLLDPVLVRVVALRAVLGVLAVHASRLRPSFGQGLGRNHVGHAGAVRLVITGCEGHCGRGGWLDGLA